MKKQGTREKLQTNSNIQIFKSQTFGYYWTLRFVSCLVVFSCSLLLTLPGMAFAQPDQEASSQEEVAPPESFEEGGNMVLELLEALPQAVGEIWDTRVIPFWLDMYHTAADFFQTHIGGWLQGLWDKAVGLVTEEAEKKQPQLEQELEKEKQELQQEVSEKTDQATRSLWERFKSLFEQ